MIGQDLPQISAPIRGEKRLDCGLGECGKGLVGWREDRDALPLRKFETRSAQQFEQGGQTRAGGNGDEVRRLGIPIDEMPRVDFQGTGFWVGLARLDDGDWIGAEPEIFNGLALGH